ncbi:MAG: CDP-diacylglycerol--glycerol-3-phosphate 3-phosphatidyltransferase [Sphaerochaetaceae bacterium]|jgi:CDP-diacylglycerol--glycerol-3-phosphate 3-phosphatidyltransferase
MNLPNKLTISRMVMAPLFFIAFHLPLWFGSQLNLVSVVLLLLLYALTELSDLFDGMIARKGELVTDLGKVMDPFADTFSRLTYFVCLTGVKVMPIWAFIIIMWREFLIVFMRMLVMGKGKAVAANIWGKAKAVLYAASGLCGIVYVSVDRLVADVGWKSWANPTMLVIFGLAALASVASFATYMRAIIGSNDLSHLSR